MIRRYFYQKLHGISDGLGQTVYGSQKPEQEHAEIFGSSVTAQLSEVWLSRRHGFISVFIRKANPGFLTNSERADY